MADRIRVILIEKAAKNVPFKIEQIVSISGVEQLAYGELSLVGMVFSSTTWLAPTHDSGTGRMTICDFSLEDCRETTITLIGMDCRSRSRKVVDVNSPLLVALLPTRPISAAWDRRVEVTVTLTLVLEGGLWGSDGARPHHDGRAKGAGDVWD